MDFFDFSGIVPALPGLWNGMVMTLKLMVMGVVGGVALGTVLALMRLSSSKWMANLAGAYVNYFRSIPLLLVITWFYLAVPFVLRWITGKDDPDRRPCIAEEEGRRILLPLLPPPPLVTIISVSTSWMASSSVMTLQRWFSGPLQARGQALYMSISYGVGGSLGGLFLAQWWERAGAESVYFVAAVLVCLSAVAATLSFRWQRNDGYQTGVAL